ncbi:hypothetical protein GSU68_11345 [Rathayibacter sp. VKM Ac-2759]|uniref:polysaccharide pyruvyl transferase family protein n=1 Tax=Rathayibacter sp. VKM Ac-2759 TaxID=2609252 RepID=UPI001315BCAC|nr:polysaccharide pyruvyl transferase family protein [Rathayibacter sp. VKM Ac-2759]QHC67099.1 hypothetical protein GSU68_11345 [Rathayibacter sp. VKM Ac-2759]
MSTRIFVNPSGQKDNLGDSVLRRGYLNALRSQGELHVFAGSHAGYVSGLHLDPQDVVYHSRRSWLLAALGRTGRGGTMAFAMNAGEWVLDGRFLVNSTWQTALLLRSRLSGARSAALGIAVRREQSRLGRAYFRSILRLVQTVSWRDPESRDDLHLGEVAPDWAFALGSAEDHLRPLEVRRSIAVVLRGDRPSPGPTWIAAVRALAGKLECGIVVVNQMREDEARCAELAEVLDGEILTWEPGVAHAAQEERVRAVYGDCVAVVSDRIHALILGLTEGAVPVGFTTSDPEKVRRTFAAMTDLPIAFAESEVNGPDDAHRRATQLLDERESLLRSLAEARRRLAELSRGLSL